ncbi:class I SAM-dependent methyltransferase [Roseiconus lacunae]|uniref:Class I SAM-dependent methyltransferase n=1 Tax=Roseiconus lacunae TaxID=2605694 RepID=A0ABT7PBK5_9BACT|nr:class I SAM-dependent methyltransferase [Roseiconus lacunae]MDM4013875.1 class I SAM-dependent methyltransferase [Roseiconus lacunae]
MAPDWNERFSDSEYAYGTEANTFLADNATMLVDPVLSIAEGEGRNAVYLATQGFRVHAVDGSEAGLEKAARLAADQNVTITSEVADLNDYQTRPDSWGSIVSIYAHLPRPLRIKLYPMLVQALKPGGISIFEAYSESQRGRGTGGPNDLELLMTCRKIEEEWKGLETILLHEIEREVHEGKFHTGMASVVQYIARKPEQN